MIPQRHTLATKSETGRGVRSATKATARGFEPLRAEPNGFLVHHLNHSVTLSTPRMCGACILLRSSQTFVHTPCVRIPGSCKQTRSPSLWCTAHVSEQRCSQYRLHNDTILAHGRAEHQNEGREIRTPNLLIWSQTRYRCAIPPNDHR